ncbi:MFS transporter [Kitasatospora sp. NPDC096128]|uniref:MFS transporter n=1 Tax=Kitasatospora sp. NPDC096128 TaxID=3155547 RepID=UPI003325CC57
MTTLPVDSATAATGRPPRQRALLFVLAGNMLIDALEVSVLLVATPAVRDDLGLSLWNTQWVMSGFALGFAALLLLGPSVTARWGRRRVYLAALVVFVAASLAGGLADQGLLLVLTRVVKGMCAALTAPTGLAIIGTTFREGPEHRRAVSVYSLFGAVGFTAGLLCSGLLTGLTWRWSVVCSAPVALVLLVFALRLIPADREPAGPESAGGGPRLRPGLLLRNGALLRSALCAASLNGAYLGLLLLVTFQLHDRLGWDSWRTALAYLPACVPLALSLPFSGQLVGRVGTDRLIVAGLLSATLGDALYLWRGTPDSYLTGVLPTMLLVGAGFVLSFAALNIQATSGIPAAEKRLAVPLYQTAVQLGAVLVLPAVAALVGDHGRYRPALLLITAVGAAGSLVALTGVRRRPRTDV